MKIGSETDSEDPSRSADGQPMSPGGDERSEESKERDLDELRRFRVRTVPPDMRRQWMLTETPVVSTLELQDTLPPKNRPSSAPPEPNAATPRPLFIAPRVSSTAATRRLQHVVPRVVPRDDRALMIAATAVGLALAVVLIVLVWKGRASIVESVVPRAPISGVGDRLPASEVDRPLALEAVRADRRDVSEPQRPLPSPPAPAAQPPVNSAAALGPSPNPSAKARRPPAEQDPKLPPSAPPASGKIPPAQKARTGRDIKSPLFGQ